MGGQIDHPHQLGHDGQNRRSPTINVHGEQPNLAVLPAYITMADDEWELDAKEFPPERIANRFRSTYGSDYGWMSFASRWWENSETVASHCIRGLNMCKGTTKIGGVLDYPTSGKLARSSHTPALIRGKIVSYTGNAPIARIHAGLSDP